jgi:hypothetical protein
MWRFRGRDLESSQRGRTKHRNEGPECGRTTDQIIWRHMKHENTASHEIGYELCHFFASPTALDKGLTRDDNAKEIADLDGRNLWKAR